MHTTTKPTPAAAATNGDTKVKRQRKAVVGHVVKFNIADDAEYTKLTQLATDDSRSPDNFALLLVRKSLKPAPASA
jgi:hypothetical protein